MNKKAIFMPMFALVVILLTGYLAYLFVSNYSNESTSYAGNSSLTLFNLYDQGENINLYTIEAIKLAAWKSIELNSDNKFIDFRNNFENEFKNQINNLLSQYPNQNVKSLNYDYTFDYQDRIIIESRLKDKLAISENIINANITYYPDLRQKVEIPFNVNYYSSIISGVKDCINSNNINQCLDNLKKNFVFTYQLNQNLINLEIPTTSDPFTGNQITIKASIVENPLLQK